MRSRHRARSRKARRRRQNESDCIAASPHVNNGTIRPRKIMRDVLIALCPALIAGCVIFGLARAAGNGGVRRRPASSSSGALKSSAASPAPSAIFPPRSPACCWRMNLPVSIPLWQAVFGALVAMVAVKRSVRRHRQKLCQPRHRRRVSCCSSRSPRRMTAWVFPDAVSSATPLAMLANGRSRSTI